MTPELVIFYVLAVLAIASAISMVLQRNPVMSAISLIGNFFCLAALYLLLRAQLLAVLQIVVYTGAIMVLVVFVIMLLNLGSEETLGERFNFKKTLGVALVCGLLLELAYIVMLGGNGSAPAGLPGSAVRVGTVESMGTAMFGKFLLPFEITSLLLLVAIVGAVILAKKKGVTMEFDALSVPLTNYLGLSAILFAIGVAGVLTRRNAIVVFMSIELMLNSVNLTLVAFSAFQGDITGQVLVFFVMAVAAAEAAVGLAIVIALFRNKQTVNIDEINILKW